MDQGILVGCNTHQQWLLPWWWKHYRRHNAYPVAFVDFGMTKEAACWCKERGIYIPFSFSLPDLLNKETCSGSIKESWEDRYGKGFWIRREAWFKKPFSLLLSPFSTGIWIDLDCQIEGSLECLFSFMNFGAEIAVVKDRQQYLDFMIEEEVQYNSGVIAFRKEAGILEQWVDASVTSQHILPGDQETLSRAIFLHRPHLIELPPVYNWYYSYGPNEHAVIRHFCGGPGKIELLKSFIPETAEESLLLLQALKSTH